VSTIDVKKMKTVLLASSVEENVVCLESVKKVNAK
jgi:hypothetical protein